jgi:type IV secretory pathway VirB4 component
MANDYANAQDLVAVENIRDNTVILKDGGLRQILLVGGVNFSLKSGAEQNLITGAYSDFLNGLNFPIQIIVHSRKINIEKYLKTLDERRAVEQSGLLRSQIEEYQEFIRKFVSENAIMQKSFFVVVPFNPVALPSKSGILSSIPFFGNKQQQGEKALEEKEAAFQENIQQLKQRTSQIIEGVGAVGLEAVLLTDELLVELFYNFYNPETVEKRA